MVPTSLGAHGLSVGASAGSPRPCTGLRGGTAATAMVMGAAGATTPLRSHPPLLLQGLRLMTTLPDAQLRRSWRPPAGVPTSPHCPKRPPGAQRGGAVPQGSGWWGLPPSHSSLLNLPERCLASPSTPPPPETPHLASQVLYEEPGQGGGFTAMLRMQEVVALEDSQVLHEGGAAAQPGP